MRETNGEDSNFYGCLFRVVSREEGEQMARDHDAMYMEVSAKTGMNITNLFQVIANNLPGNENNKIFTSEARNSRISLTISL